MRIIFVTGTDTDVGKTFISYLLMKSLLANGVDAKYYKPIQTGCKSADDTFSDAKFVVDNLRLPEYDINSSIGLLFKNAKAPLFASIDAKHKINYEDVKKKILALNKHCDTLVCEGAGGLYVPITKEYFMIDLIKDLNAEVVLVGRAGLGTQNHTIMSAKLLLDNGIKDIHIFLSNVNNSGEVMVNENIEIIKYATGIDKIGLIPKLYNTQNIPQEIVDLFKVFSKK